MMAHPLRRYIAAPAILLLICISGSCATMGVMGGPDYSRIISGDTVWSGEVDVDGVVLVRKGATLTIMAGTTVTFSTKRTEVVDEHEGFSGSGIKVEGRIVAEGTKEEPVRFTSADPAGPGSWDRLYFVFSKGSVLHNCVIEYGGYAVHAHFSVITISSSLFRRNVEGVRLGSSKVTIRDSVFTGNRVRGINFKECRNDISGCAVYNNGVGIFLHSKNSRSIIRDNAVYNNRRYDLQVGDLHVDDIDVSRNWWGSSDSAFVEKRIYDGRDQEGIGRATFSPFLEKPSVRVSSVKGFLTFRKRELNGRVYAVKKLDEGFDDSKSLASVETDDSGAFELFLPPGRYFLYGRASLKGRELFGFTGNNPLLLDPFGEYLHVIPLVGVENTSPAIDCSEGAGEGIVVSVREGGRPVSGSFAYLYTSDAIDIRGPGVSSGITSPGGTVRFRVGPGNYLVVARKRPGGQSLGFVEFGGLFGISPHLPVPVRDGCVTSVVVPVFAKEGIVAEDADSTPLEVGGNAAAFYRGIAANGYLVYFYYERRAVGRPAFVSGVVSENGGFSVENVDSVADGIYFAYLRKAAEETAGSSELIESGPLQVRIREGVISPTRLDFD